MACLIAGIAFLSLARWRPYTSSETFPSKEGFLLFAPAALTQQLKSELPPGVTFFNPQAWGSWFELQLPSNPVAVDSRFEAIPQEAWDDYLDVSNGRQGWQRILDRWGVKIAVLERNQQKFLIPRMESDPNWRLVYQDGQGLIFRRR